MRGTAVLILAVVAALCLAGCIETDFSDEHPATVTARSTPVPTVAATARLTVAPTASSTPGATGARFAMGDIVREDRVSTDQGWLIMEYRASTDSYVMQPVYYQNDVRRWVYYEWKPSTSKRDLVETIYPVVLARTNPARLERYDVSLPNGGLPTSTLAG